MLDIGLRLVIVLAGTILGGAAEVSRLRCLSRLRRHPPTILLDQAVVLPVIGMVLLTAIALTLLDWSGHAALAAVYFATGAPVFLGFEAFYRHWASTNRMVMQGQPAI